MTLQSLLTLAAQAAPRPMPRLLRQMLPRQPPSLIPQPRLAKRQRLCLAGGQRGRLALHLHVVLEAAAVVVEAVGGAVERRVRVILSPGVHDGRISFAVRARGVLQAKSRCVCGRR